MSVLNTWITRLDDRVNPIVLKELRQAVNGRFVAAVLGMFLLISLITVTVALMQINPSDASQELGQGTLLGLNGILVATCILFLPIYTAARMAAERSDTNTDLLFISTLRPRQIISGKLLASAVLGLLIYSACMPFMTLTYLLRGVDLPSIFLVLAMGYTVVLVAIALALFAACATVSRGFRVMLALSLLATLGMAISGAIGGSVGITESGLASTIDQAVFWGVLATWVLSITCSIALLFSFSVALISPPASNRAIGPRLTITAVWLVHLVGGYTWIVASGDDEWIVLMWIAAVFFPGMILLIAIGERDRWTDRLLRTVPRRLVPRLLAMLFYSGAVGGTLLAWVLFVASMAAMTLTVQFHPAFKSHSGNYDDMVRAAFGIFLFLYAYAMTARLLRTYLLATWIKQEQTWAVAGVIASLCIGIPVVMELLTTGPGDWGSTRYWSIFSPVALVYGDTVADSAMVLAVTWAIIVTALNLTWFVRQLADFRRPVDLVT